MAVWSMADVLFDGEQFTARWRRHIADRPELTLNDCYPTVLPLDRVRASYAGTLWGPQPVFFTWFDTDARQGEDVFRKQIGWERHPPTFYRRIRYGTGLMLVHDTFFWWWGEFGICGANRNVWARRARWGWDETVTFVPYWDDKGLIELESPDRENIVASAWFRPDGNLMAIIFNNTDEVASVRLKVNARRFPVELKAFSRAEDITSPVPALDPGATEADRYDYSDGGLDVDMRPRDFRLLVFE